MGNCPVCKDEADFCRRETDNDNYDVDCIRCGKYSIANITKIWLQKESSLTLRQRANLSGYIYRYQNSRLDPDNTNDEQIKNLSPPSFHERADRLLIEIERETDHLGKFVEWKLCWLSATWCIDSDELDEIIKYLINEGWIVKSKTGENQGRIGYKIASNGWARLDEIRKINPESEQAFVAMWFDEKLDQIYFNCISKAIEDAGYKPHRVDEGEYTDKICDEIIAQIKQSRFIVSDFTGHRGGVYYEAGFAKGLGLEVIWTCRKDHIKKLHFDIQQYNFIDWETDKPEKFRKKLTNRIESVIGKGTYKAGGKDGD